MARQVYASGNTFDGITTDYGVGAIYPGALGVEGCHDCEAANNVIRDADDALGVQSTKGVANQPCFSGADCDADPADCTCTWEVLPEDVSLHDNRIEMIRATPENGDTSRLSNLFAFGGDYGTDLGLTIDENTYCVDDPVSFRIGNAGAASIDFGAWQSAGFDLASTFVPDADCPGSPVTTITDGPPANTIVPAAMWAFSANESATFECRLDSAPWSPCTSPYIATNLVDGDHVFGVRATATATGITESPPQSSEWTIDRAVDAGDAALTENGVPFPTLGTGVTPLVAPLRLRYADPAAAAGGDGSLAAPYNDLQAAFCALVPGDRLVLVPGDFTAPARVDAANGCVDGTATNPIQVTALPGSRLVLDPLETGVAVQVRLAWWQFQGLDIDSSGSSASAFETHDPTTLRATPRCGRLTTSCSTPPTSATLPRAGSR